MFLSLSPHVVQISWPTCSITYPQLSFVAIAVLVSFISWPEWATALCHLQWEPHGHLSQRTCCPFLTVIHTGGYFVLYHSLLVFWSWWHCWLTDLSNKYFSSYNNKGITVLLSVMVHQVALYSGNKFLSWSLIKLNLLAVIITKRQKKVYLKVP